MKQMIILMAVISSVCNVFGVATTHLSFDGRSGVREVTNAQELCYDAGWAANGETAEIYNGSTLLASGKSGIYTWTPTECGTNTLYLKIFDASTNLLSTQTAEFSVWKEIKTTDGDNNIIVYYLNDDFAKVVSCMASGDLIIPNEINGIPVAEIDSNAFVNCTALSSIVLPESITSIRSGAFRGCSGLQKIQLPFIGSQRGTSGSTFFGYIFGASSSSQNSSYVPTNLKEVVITDDTGIGSYAFSGCSDITSIIIPRLNIEDAVNVNTNSLIISDNFNNGLLVRYIFDDNGYDSSGNGYDITNIGVATEVQGRNGNSDKAYLFSGNSFFKAKVDFEVVNCFSYSVWFKTTAKKSDYGEASTYWNPGNDIIGTGYSDNIGVGLRVGRDGIAIVEHHANYRSTVLDITCTIDDSWHNAIVTVNNGLETLYLDGVNVGSVVPTKSGTRCLIFDDEYGIGGGQWGLYTGSVDDFMVWDRVLSEEEIAGLQSGNLIENADSIGMYAFSGCRGLTNITIPDNVTIVGVGAFYGCSGLTSVTIPNSVTNIGECAFGNCASLIEFTVDDNNQTYHVVDNLLLSKDGRHLIAGVNGEVIIPNSVTSIDSCAFYGCSGLTSVTIPDSVTSISGSAFNGCSSLQKIQLPFIGSQRGTSGYTNFGYIFGASSY